MKLQVEIPRQIAPDIAIDLASWQEMWRVPPTVWTVRGIEGKVEKCEVVANSSRGQRVLLTVEIPDDKAPALFGQQPPTRRGRPPKGEE